MFSQRGVCKMSDRDDIEKSSENEINLYDMALNVVPVLVDLVPIIEERKKEAEAKRDFAKNVPEGFIEEQSPKLRHIQLSDEQQLEVNVNTFLKASRDVKIKFENSTGTSSAFQEMAYMAPALEPRRSSKDWKSVINQFNQLAQDKSRKSEIPKRLDELHEDLGKMFVIAQQTFIKAKNSIININLAASDMKNVLQHIWGNLVHYSQKIDPDKWDGIQHKQFKKQAHRKIASDCLASNDLDKDKLGMLLDYMYRLHTDLSVTEFGKNPLGKDIVKLDEYYYRWITQIDDLVNLVDFSFLKE
jgi:hypothetical protein